MIRPRLVLALGLALLGAGSVWAAEELDLDGVLARAREAMGGAEALGRVTSIAARADGSTAAGTYEIGVYSVRGRGVFFMHVRPGGTPRWVLLDGGEAWTRLGGPGPYSPLDPVRAEAVRGHEFQMIAVAPEDWFLDMELVGPAAFDELETLEVSARDRLGRACSLFFDSTSGLPAGMILPSGEGEETVRISLEEWRDVDGVLLPVRVVARDQTGTFTLEYTSVALNSVDRRLFDTGSGEVPELLLPRPSS